MTIAYSAIPLAKKLSLKDGMRTWWDGMPDSVRAEIERENPRPELLPAPEKPLDAAHIFVTLRTDLESKIKQLQPLLVPNGFIWVSWPKKASKVATDITEEGIRDAIPTSTDLVDVKVCAVDAVWSGLKLVIRKTRR